MLRKWRSDNSMAQQNLPKYFEVCRTVSRQLEKAGLRVTALGPSAKARFLAHPDPNRVLQTLQTYSDVLEAQFDAGESLRDDKKLLWRMLSKMGYAPRAEAFEAIEAGDVIEVFTEDNWQIFRNMTYFDLIHITVDELATLRWSRDYKRPLAFLLSCIRLGLMFKSGMIRETQAITMSRHEIQLHGGGLWQKFSIKLKVISPLKKDGVTDAYIITSDPKPLSLGAV
ncbi:MAG: hypothetical protein KF789_08435 [Bdellovibrionaceae bacterium]|nr:hypothetical protein [Pseudobdellovibrionaceae bacterium]